MNDTMRFSPDTLEVREGETVRLSVHNDGKLPHELVLGTDQEIREHAEQMKGGTSSGHHDHAGGAAIELAPGQSGELVVRFGKAATLQIACLVPGHYEAGMKGAVRVTSGPARGAPETRPLKQPAAHDHSTHKH